MEIFTILVIAHVIAGATGLVAFWVPIGSRKGASRHRRGGRIAIYGFQIAGALAVAMALLSLFQTDRHPEIADRALYRGLFGWMMLYLGVLTLALADYGLAVLRHKRDRLALRRFRYQWVMAAVVLSGGYCGIYGAAIGDPLMVMVAGIGIATIAMQQVFVWREYCPGLAAPPARAYIGEHFRALIGMGISAYTAFMAVGLIRFVPAQVFNPLVWAGPSIIGVALIILFTSKAKRTARRSEPIGAGTRRESRG